MKKLDLFIRFVLIPLIINVLLYFLSIQDFFRRGFSTYYHSSWEVLTYTSLNFRESDYFYSYLLTIGFLMSFIALVIQSIRAIMFVGFPSIKEARFYYKELSRIKRASQAIKEKERLEKVRQEYKLKLAHLEEEKKKYL